MFLLNLHLAKQLTNNSLPTVKVFEALIAHFRINVVICCIILGEP